MINIAKLIEYRDERIRIEVVQDRIGAPAIIFSSGFLSENDGEWSNFFKKKFPEHQLLRVRWKSSSFRELVGIMAKGLGKRLLVQSFARGLPTFTTLAGLANPFTAPIAAVSTVYNLSEVLKVRSLWSEARNESERAGKCLAKALNMASNEALHDPNDEFVHTVLLGHSLGARLMVSCLEETYRGIIQRAVLLGGAVDAEGASIPKVRNKTVHPSINCYSEKDSVLKWIYRLGNLSQNGAIGRTALDFGYENYDTTLQVPGHGEYCGNEAVAEIICRGIHDTLHTITNPIT